METFEWDQLGRTDLLAEGHQLNKAELLFEKIEDETIQALWAMPKLATKKPRKVYRAKAVSSGV
jgi:methionyl-tRNA synthetase